MSHFKLGEMEKAEKYRVKFTNAMKLESFKDDDESKSFAAEVEQLFDTDKATSEQDEAEEPAPRQH